MGPIGDSTVKQIHGIRSNNGSSPSHWAAGAGGVARKALQALEGLKLAEKDPNGGRRLTSQGRRDLDRIAAQIKLAAAEKAKKAAAAEAVIAIAYLPPSQAPRGSPSVESDLGQLADLT